MPKKTIWTDGQDTQIRRLRTEGANWDIIAAALGLARWTVIERARRLGIRRPPTSPILHDLADRLALPAGHAESWGAITRGSCLQGVAYPIPGALR